MSPIDDPEVVAAEYASERGLLGRASVYRRYPIEGPDANDVALDIVAGLAPRRVLEVGCGTGGFAAAVVARTGADVQGLDISPRMVELTEALGVPARVGTVEALPFEDASFDLVVANWMLYHVPDLDRGIAESARVLAPGGHLVAVTNGEDHLREIKELVGATHELSFTGENGAALLGRHFSSVERTDCTGWVTFPDHAAVAGYVDASRLLRPESGVVDAFDGPLRVRRSPYVFLAAK